MSAVGHATFARATPLRVEQIVTILCVASSLAYAAVVMLVASPVSFYTLDDPYIHMALAENIARGHFGVNAGEASNPSSSILWPWLLAAFDKIGLMLWAPLFVNIASFTLTVRLVMDFAIRLVTADRTHAGPVAIFAGLMLFSFNVFGLIFTGMEHSLHTLLCAVIVVRSIECRYDRQLFMAMVLCPLVRFEGAAFLAFGLGAALFDRRYRFAATALAAVIAIFGLYVWRLSALGLPMLPSSVLAKSSVASEVVDRATASFGPVLKNLRQNVNASTYVAFVLIAAGLLFASIKRTGRERVVALGLLAVLALTFSFGPTGWYHRYEVYALVALATGCIYLFRTEIRAVLVKAGRFSLTAGFCGGLAAVILSGWIGPLVLQTTPEAARNIDRQQHQMHRLLTECWKQPVAVNDLGWASFRNDYYVLDLYGLGNEAARKARLGAEPGWMQVLADQAGADLAMIYDDWFLDRPASWTKVGELVLTERLITPASASVAFYATRPDAEPRIGACLRQLSASLPAGAAIRFAERP
jgi:hypothetical protein